MGNLLLVSRRQVPLLAMDTDRKSRTDAYKKLPPSSEVEIIKVLLDPSLREVAFFKICDQRPNIFGEKGSNLRNQVRNRRFYLLNNPEALARAKKRWIDSERNFDSPFSTTSHNSCLPSPPSFSTSFSPITRSDLSKHLFATSPPPRQTFCTTNMSAAEEEDVATVRKYDLSLYEPWKNAENLLVLVGERSHLDGVNAATRVNIYVPIPCVVDYYEGRYKAFINSTDYGTIGLIKPSLLNYQVQKHSYIQKVEDPKHKEPKIDEQHKVISASCKRPGNQKNLKVRLDLKLPNGMTASNAAYNKGIAGLELEFRLRRVGVRSPIKMDDGSEVKIEQTHFFGVISILIDGSQIPIEDDKKTTKEADALADLLGGTLAFEE